jgi:CheY-like chemotaxis protein
VLINILSNAVKYTEPGGIVRIDLREETLPDDKMVRLIYKVSDTGVGMTEDFMRTMYKPFAREQDGRIGKIQGTGLGLAITKQMVDLMNGTIECESQVGKGTTFTVMLDFPIAEKMLDDLILPPIRLLMVDDDEVTLVSAKDTLKDIGIQADTCNNGKRAVEMVEEHHLARRDYQIVILDWIMPDMNGLEVTREIRRRIGENIPILIVSAYDWTDIEVEARAAGVSGFISKPLFRSNLYDSINKALQIKEVDESSLEDTAEDLKGTRVLIAEDNDMNWEIISELLSMYEIQADRAVNGQVCVDMVEKAEPGTYQIIFMDIQMPVMNGLDAARAIRKSKVGSHVSQIPIVAMTADAFAENITECRAAGMNDHIPKPVDLNLVLKSMRKLLGNGHRNGGEEYV